MPAISLVVCVYRQRDLLKRLLQESSGCYDELVVVHDGPDKDEVKAVVEAAKGCFFERPGKNQQEPHWPFAWEQAKHDWILRLDADEFPSVEMKAWLQEFREAPEPPADISGYTCLWPLWNGKRAVTQNWPDGRIFLFHKQRVRFIGMVEATPVPDERFEPLKLVLRHEPLRKSYGVRNILMRRQAYNWREVISQSLMGPPTALPCWRWTSEVWPTEWEEVRQKPLRTAFKRLLLGPARQTREMWRRERKLDLSVLMGTGLHQFFIATTFFFFRRRRNKLLTL